MLEKIHLTIIREVHRQQTLTQAAKSLFLTQSALSHAIKKLEHQLGTPVWHKEGRHLRLTEAGEYLLQMANRILPQFEHGEVIMRQFASGKRGLLRIGMECHPCYQWLLKVVAPYLKAYPQVDVDVKQAFQFGGIGALYGHEIDILITPDPLNQKGLVFTPIFDYQQVLVVSDRHPLAKQTQVEPADLGNEVLFTYPVEADRLDIFTAFLLPAHCRPQSHRTIETTEILLQMVAAGRGVTALPLWLVEDYQSQYAIKPIRLGSNGVAKTLYFGTRSRSTQLDYLEAFIEMACAKPWT